MRKVGCGCLVTLIASIAIFAVLLHFVFGSGSPGYRETKAQSPRISPSRDLTEPDVPFDVPGEVSIASYKVRNQASQMTGSFRLHNGKDVAIKDVLIHCKLIAASGTQIGLARATVYETIRARSTILAQGVSFGFPPAATKRVNCAVESYAYP